jgi:hypothetical protein
MRKELRQLALVSESSVDLEAAFYGSVLVANAGLRGGEIKKITNFRRRPGEVSVNTELWIGVVDFDRVFAS